MTKIGDRIRRAVKHIPRLPRKWRVVRNLICCVLLLLFIWYAMGPPVLTAEKAFRRAERADLSEPSEIILRIEQDNVVYFIGRGSDEYLIGSGRFAGLRGWFGSVRHLEKTDEIIVVPLKSYESSLVAMQMLLFSEVEDAVRGEVDITASAEGKFNGTPFHYCETYTIRFEPVADGLLTGWLYPINSDEDTWEGYVERRALREIYDEYTTLPIEIRLYNAAGELIHRTNGEYSYPDY